MAPPLPPVICTACWEAAEVDNAREVWYCPRCEREITHQAIMATAPSLGNPRQ